MFGNFFKKASFVQAPSKQRTVTAPRKVESYERINPSINVALLIREQTDLTLDSLVRHKIKLERELETVKQLIEHTATLQHTATKIEEITDE